MKIDVRVGDSPLDLSIGGFPPGLEALVLSGSMEHDGEGYFLNFEIPSLRHLSLICYWLEEKRPALRVCRLVPGHLSKSESRAIRELEAGVARSQPEWSIKVNGRGEVAFLMSVLFEWRSTELYYRNIDL